jgi:hypothetical protein
MNHDEFQDRLWTNEREEKSSTKARVLTDDTQSCSRRDVYLCLAAALAGLNRRGDAIRALEDALQLQWGSEEEAAVGAENDDGTVPAPFNIDVKNVFEGQLEIAKAVSRHAGSQVSGRFRSNSAVFNPQRRENGRPILI